MSPECRSAAYAGVALVSTDHRGYQEHRQRIVMTAVGIRRDTTPDALGMWGAEAENVVRAHLGTLVPLSDRRILTYQERRQGGFSRNYRELDAVCLGPGRAVTVFEVKCSVQRGMLRAGRRQLALAAEALAGIYRPVRRVLVVTAPPWATKEEASGWPERFPAGYPDAVVLDHPGAAFPEERLGFLWLDPCTLPLPAFDLPELPPLPTEAD